MATFTVMSGNGVPLVWLEADDERSVPTDVTAAPGSEGIESLVGAMISDDPEHTTCLVIATRMGGYAYLSDGKQTEQEKQEA